MNRDRVFVILPGGYLDLVPADRVPGDVELEPIPTTADDEYNLDVDLVITFYDIYPIISRDVRAQARYIRMREDGQSHNMAEMLATRSFPGFKSDSIFNEGRCNGNQFEKMPALGNYYRTLAEAAGVSTTGMHYCSGLADYPGDPSAWISGRGDAERVAREKGFTLTGYASYRPGEREPMPDVEIGQDIIDNEVEDILESNPGARADDVREAVYQLRTGKVDPNPPVLQEAAP